MAVNVNDVLRMYVLIGVTLPNQAFLKKRYPNVAYVLEHPDPSADNDTTFNRELFKSVDSNVYAKFHEYLKGLNNGSITTPATVEHTQLQGAYAMAGSMVTFADLAFSSAPAMLWTGGSQHPPLAVVSDWANKLS